MQRRRRSGLRSKKVLRVPAAGEGELRTRQRGGEMRLSSSMSPVGLRANYQPVTAGKLRRRFHETGLQSIRHPGRYNRRTLHGRSWYSSTTCIIRPLPTMRWALSSAVIRLSVHPSVCPMPLAQKRGILGLLLLQNTNRKPHAGSEPLVSVEVAETTPKPLPALIRKHSLDGCSIDMLQLKCRRQEISFHHAIPCLCSESPATEIGVGIHYF